MSAQSCRHHATGFCRECSDDVIKIESQNKALQAAHSAMTHALTLGHCGEGSTRGMVLDAIREIEKVLPDPTGGIFVDENEAPSRGPRLGMKCCAMAPYCKCIEKEKANGNPN